MGTVRRAAAAAQLLIGLALAASAWGADIRGVVRYAGPVAERGKLPVTIDQYICGKEKDVEDLVLGPERGVLNAVIWLDKPPDGAKWPSPLPKVEMDQKGCVFVPRVVLVPMGGTVEFLNSDRLLHNVHSLSKDNPRFSRTQPRGRTVPVTFGKPEIVPISCDLHSWMRSFVVVADHPFYALSDAAGAFTLANVPPGRYTVRMWQEALGTAAREVIVGPEGATLTFDIKARR